MRFETTKFMATHPEGSPQVVTAPLHVVIALKDRGEKASLLDRYQAAQGSVSKALGALLHRRFVLGINQQSPDDMTYAATTRVGGEASAGRLAEEMFFMVCPPLLAEHKFSIAKLDVAFGVYENATCEGKKAADVQTPYDNGYRLTWRI